MNAEVTELELLRRREREYRLRLDNTRRRMVEVRQAVEQKSYRPEPVARAS